MRPSILMGPLRQRHSAVRRGASSPGPCSAGLAAACGGGGTFVAARGGVGVVDCGAKAKASGLVSGGFTSGDVPLFAAALSPAGAVPGCAKFGFVGGDSGGSASRPPPQPLPVSSGTKTATTPSTHHRNRGMTRPSTKEKSPASRGRAHLSIPHPGPLPEGEGGGGLFRLRLRVDDLRHRHTQQRGDVGRQ